MNKLFSMVVDGIIFNGIIIVGCAVMLFVLFASKKLVVIKLSIQ